MDENAGKLRMLTEEEAKPHLKAQAGGKSIDHFFHTGEEIMLKGSLFRVQNVTPKGLRLKVLRRTEAKEEDRA